MNASAITPTPNGWTTMGQLQVGDYVFDETGSLTQVVQAHDIMLNHDCYELTFSDEEKIIADAEHLWFTLTLKDRSQMRRLTDSFRLKRRQTRPKRGKGKRPDLTVANQNRIHTYKTPIIGSLKTTKEIAQTIRQGNRVNHSIPMCQSLKLPHAELPINPYVLGAWLGDGTSKSPTITDGSKGVITEITQRGYPCRKLKTALLWRIEKIKAIDLRKLDVYANKHIPPAYLRADTEQRLELLRGLMDTDGSVTPQGHCEITQVKQRLAENICELINSLGIKAAITEGNATIKGRFICKKYRINFLTEHQVFSVLQKKVKQKRTNFRGTHAQRYIVSAQKVPSVPVRCIKVAAASGKFLVGKRFIPTHNTEALLMCALQYVHIPGYNAIIFRKTLQDHKKPEGLIQRTLEWLGNTDAHWNGQDYKWTFPSGATLTLGYMDNDVDVYHHQSAAYQFIGWDELTQFLEWQYCYMKSRLRRLKTSSIPLRICGATNPEPNWVKQYFLIEGEQNGRVFIPAKARDNPFLDWETYLRNLSELDPVSRARLRDGDWNITVEGNVFKRGKFHIVKDAPASMRLCRMWDKAATEPSAGKDPAYTVGLKLGAFEGKYYVLDIVRFRGAPALVEATIKQTAILDKANVMIGIEQEPGSAGVDDIDYYQRKVLQGFNVRAVKVTGNKLERAGPVSSAVDAGNVSILEAKWNSDFLDEVSVFPEGKFKDQVDALSAAFSLLTQGGAVTPAWVLG